MSNENNPIELPEVTVMPAKHVSEKGIELIAHFEGLELKAYPDPGTGGDPWTIGFGATFYENGTKVKKGDIITAERAKALLSYHLRKFELTVLNKIKRPLLQRELDAAVSFCFNAGTSYKLGGQWKDFDIWNRIQNNTPAEQMRPYWESLAVTGGGKKLTGLVRRRKSEVHLYNTGELVFYS